MQKHCSLSLFLDLDVAVGILARKVVFCRDFILRAVATFWAMSLVGIYPGRASLQSNGLMFPNSMFTAISGIFPLGDY